MNREKTIDICTSIVLILFFLGAIALAVHNSRAQPTPTEPTETTETVEMYNAVDKTASSETVAPTTIETTTEEPTTKKSLGMWTITAYCPCFECCGKYALNRPDGVVFGASGHRLIPGISVGAAKSAKIPYETVLEIDGYGLVIVHDRVHNRIDARYGGKVLDIYFETHEEAKQFGKRVLEVKED